MPNKNESKKKERNLIKFKRKCIEWREWEILRKRISLLLGIAKDLIQLYFSYNYCSPTNRYEKGRARPRLGKESLCPLCVYVCVCAQ